MKDEKMTLSHLASIVAEKMQIDQESASMFLDSLFEQVTEGLKTDKMVKINGLGTFRLQWNAPRKSVDVNTGEEITISGYNKVVFAPEIAVKAKINEPFAHLEPIEIDANGEAVAPNDSEIPMQKLDEQAEEIKDILSEINSMHTSENKEVNNTEETETVPQISEEKPIETEAEKPAEPKIEEEKPAANVPEKTSKLTTTKEKSPIVLPKPAPTKGKRWIIMGICIGIFIAILIALYFIFQNQIEQWVENKLNATEQTITPTPNEDIFIEPNAEVEEPAPEISIFDQPRNYTEFLATEKLPEGARLASLARKYYGAAEFWVFIYEANKAIIDNPNYVMAGTMLQIPKVADELIDTNNPACFEYAQKLHDQYLK